MTDKTLSTIENVFPYRMESCLDMTMVIPTDEMVGDDEQDAMLLRDMLKEAREYLMAQSWCHEIVQSSYGFGVGKIVAVFLFRIIPAREHVDSMLWVIVGDIPPLYITTDCAPNPACALDAYIGAMDAWVEACLHNTSREGLPPLNVPPTREWALDLQQRLSFIDKNILAWYKDDLT